MDYKNGRPQAKGRKSRPLNYFYVEKLLHKKHHINRGKDEITAWCYPHARLMTYSYASVKRRMEPAFTTQEVAKMLNRGRITLETAILDGCIEAPQFTYGLNEARKKFKYMWHEDNIIEAHTYLSGVHFGRPRKDGLITPKRLPSVRELRAMIRHKEVLYVKDPVSGEYLPTYQASNI